MVMGVRLRHPFEGEFIVVTSHAPLLGGASARPFSDSAEALNFLWGVMSDGVGSHALGDLFYQLDVGGPREFSGSEALHGLASQLASGAIRLVSVDAVEATAVLGMNPRHLRRLQGVCQRERMLLVVRDSKIHGVQYHALPGFSSKDVKVKDFNTAKDGRFRGLVVVPDVLTEAQKKNLKKLVEEEGYSVDKNRLLRDPHGNAIHGDYDVQGAFRLLGDDYFQVPVNDRGPPDKPKEPLLAMLNREVCPERPMFRHGANDEGGGFPDDGSAPDPDKGNIVEYYEEPHPTNPHMSVLKPLFNRAPKPEERFLVVHPNGETQVMNSAEELKAFYLENDIQWHYDNWQKLAAKR
jgi:hypothetical protein